MVETDITRMTMIDSNTVAIVYQGTGADGFLIIYDISSTGDITNTRADVWEFDGSNGGTPNIIKIDGNVFAIAYEDIDYDGFIKTLTIADTGIVTKSWIDTLEFDTVDAGYQYLFHVADNVYGVSYQGTAADGFLCTMTIDNDGTISNALIDSLEFDIYDNVWYAPVIPVSGDYFLIVYDATGNDGMSHTVEVNTDAGWKVWTDESNPDTSSPWSWDFNFPDGPGYYQFISTGRKSGVADESLPHTPDAKCYSNYNGPYTLTLTTSGTGTGTIEASPAAGPYYYGATVTIWENASVGSTFAVFTGSLTGTTTLQILTVDGNEAVDAAITLNSP